MKYLSRFLILGFIAVDVVTIVWLLIHGHTVALLQTRGLIATSERNLAFTAILLMLIVVVPVLLFAVYVGFNFHADNSKKTYAPDWDHNTRLQVFIWTLPITVITILCIITWIYAHKLDPHVALASTTKPITIQVVALRWKWLFIYPEQNIATVNYVEFPEKTPITFELTGDEAPMNSFWIPQLGGQIYAMSGMATQTHLIADGIGQYRGSSAEISGEGFTGMRFVAKSVSQNDFDNWVSSVKQSPQKLDTMTYNKLVQPSEDTPVTLYSSTENNLYTTIIKKYMAPSSNQQMQTQPNENQEMNSMQGM